MVDSARVAHARIAAGLTVSQLAKAASVSRSSVEAFERGRCELQTFRTAAAVAHALGVPLKDLIADEEEPAPGDRSGALPALPSHLMLLLFSARKRLSRAVICEILVWSSAELASASDALSALLQPTGLRLRQTPGGLDLVTRTTAADREVVGRTARHLKSRIGVSNQDAKVLYTAIRSMAAGDPTGWIGQPPGGSGPGPRTDGAASLAAAGLIVHDKERNGWTLAEDVRFSLEVAAEVRREILDREARISKHGHSDAD